MLRARLVLDDSRYALGCLEDASSDVEFRVRWVALVTLLRAVGHVLEKVDGESDPALGRVIKNKWNEWHREPGKHGLFLDFIECERNAVLKTYEQGWQSDDITLVVTAPDGQEVFALGECIFKPLFSGSFAGEDGRDIARDAIRWWDEQLTAIDRERGA